MINQYASTPNNGLGGRTHHLAREFAALGFRVYLIAARWHHYLIDRGEASQAPELEPVDGYTFVRLPVMDYEHAHDRKRILNWFLFNVRLRQLSRMLPHAPDAVFYSSPSLIPFRGAARLAQCHRARLAFEVRDIWPLTLCQLGGYAPSHPAIRYMQWIEDQAYRQADVAISPLSNASEHMRARGLDPAKFLHVPNGFSDAELADPDPLPKDVEQDLPRDKFVLGYVGTIGTANCIDTLLDAAARLRHRPDIAIRIVGQGQARNALIKRVASEKLDAVSFVDAVPKRQVQSALARFDAAYLGWHASPLYDFGISPNKLVDYMYAGLPVLHAYSGRGDPVAAAGFGLSVPAGDGAAVAAAAERLADMSPVQRQRLGEIGHRVACGSMEYGALAASIAARLFPQ
ncbi:glycosyltransferase family 4 protein [Mesorhizobium sp. Z1-4]|uniref:glycosyltransferase family 4 protein n=1 Tax=Mesorhizobium sp. Z1-4 TaxID=2448478 RepID=UPI000FD8817B|nr:glycosyltransferase family 4 protein [Mesorhizobium sp. Z1-4]